MSADAADSRADPEPPGSTYTAVFHDVWVAAIAAVEALRGWSITSSDSRAGTIDLVTADRLGRSPAPARLHLSLDEVGLTRLEIRAAAPGARGTRDRRRARRLLARIERHLPPPPSR